MLDGSTPAHDFPPQSLCKTDTLVSLELDKDKLQGMSLTMAPTIAVVRVATQIRVFGGGGVPRKGRDDILKNEIFLVKDLKSKILQ